MEKLLRINMSAEGGPEVNVIPIGEYAGLGGRALTSAVISKEVPPLAPSVKVRITNWSSLRGC